MEEIKDFGKIHKITFDGYKFVCFANSKDEKRALEIVKKEGIDGAILGSVNTDLKTAFGFVLHFITNKDINVKRLTDILVNEGKKNGLYAKHANGKTPNSARVYSANLKLIL
jgi:hypothetical protein